MNLTNDLLDNLLLVKCEYNDADAVRNSLTLGHLHYRSPLSRAFRGFYCIPCRRYSAPPPKGHSSGGCPQFGPRFFGMIFRQDFIDWANFDEAPRIHKGCLVADRADEIIGVAG